MDPSDSNVELAKLHFEIGNKFATLAMQAWNFHLIAALGVAGWAAAQNNKLELHLAILVAACLAGVLGVTAWSAHRLGNSAKEAMLAGQNVLAPNDRKQFQYFNFNRNKLAAIPLLVVDGLAIIATGVLFAK